MGETTKDLERGKEFPAARQDLFHTFCCYVRFLWSPAARQDLFHTFCDFIRFLWNLYKDCRTDCVFCLVYCFSVCRDHGCQTLKIVKIYGSLSWDHAGRFAQHVQSILRQSFTTCCSFLPDLAIVLMLCILCPFLVVANVVFTIICFIWSVTKSAGLFLQVSFWLIWSVIKSVCVSLQALFFPCLSSCVKPIVLILSSCVEPIVLMLVSGMQYLFLLVGFVMFVICYLIWLLLKCVFDMLQALCLISVWCLPIMFVVALISYVAWKHSDMITWSVATLYEAMSSMIASITSFFTNPSSNPFPSMVTSFKHFFHRIASSMTELVTEVSTFVVNTFTKTIPSFCTAAIVFLQSTVTHLIIGISTFFKTGIHSLDTKAMEFLKGMTSLVTNLFHKLGTILTNCLSELVNPIVVMFTGVVDFFRDLAMAFPGLFTKAMQFIHNMMDAVPNLISRLGAYILTAVNEVIKVTTNAFHEVGHLLLLPVAAVSNFFQAVASSIGHMLMAIPNFFHEVGHLLLLPVVAVYHFFEMVIRSIGHMFMAIPNFLHEVGHLLLLPVVAVLHFFEMVIRSIGHMFMAIPNFFHEVGHLLLLPVVAVLHFFEMVIRSIGHMFMAIPNFFHQVVHLLLLPFVAVLHLFQIMISSIGHIFTAVGALLSKIVMALCAPFIAVLNFFKSIINLF